MSETLADVEIEKKIEGIEKRFKELRERIWILRFLNLLLAVMLLTQVWLTHRSIGIGKMVSDQRDSALNITHQWEDLYNKEQQTILEPCKQLLGH